MEINMKKIVLSILSVVVVLGVMLFAYMGYFFKQQGVISQGQPIVRGEIDNPALLVIDIQEGITGKLASSYTRGLARQSGPFIQTVNAAIEKAQLLNMPVIYIRQENTDKIINFLTGGKMLKEGTASTALDARVKVVPGTTFIKYQGDSFSNPELDAFLQDQQINHLYMTGLSATQCVHRTIKAAVQRNYAVTAISDALISSTKEKKAAVLKEYKQEGVELIVMEQWE
jgi:nicotinamidase-related amidase